MKMVEFNDDNDSDDMMMVMMMTMIVMTMMMMMMVMGIHDDGDDENDDDDDYDYDGDDADDGDNDDYDDDHYYDIYGCDCYSIFSFPYSSSPISLRQNEYYLELSAKLQDAQSEASRAKKKGDKERKKEASDKIQNYVKGTSLVSDHQWIKFMCSSYVPVYV